MTYKNPRPSQDTSPAAPMPTVNTSIATASPTIPAATPSIVPALTSNPALESAPAAPTSLNQTWQEMLADAPPQAAVVGKVPPTALPDDTGIRAAEPAATEPVPTEGEPAVKLGPPVTEAESDIAPTGGPSDDASLDFETLGEPRSDEAALLARITQEEQRRIHAQRKIGEQGHELGQLRARVDELQQLMEQRAAAPAAIPAATKEEIVTRILDGDLSVLDPIVDARLTSRLDQILAERQMQASAQAAEDAPVVAGNAGFRLFASRFPAMIGDTEAAQQSWQASEAGRATVAIVVSDPDRQAALLTYLQNGEPEGVARVLSRAYKDHLAGKKSAAVKRQAVAEIRRVESAKSSALPSSNTPVLTPSRKSFDEMSYQDILALP